MSTADQVSLCCIDTALHGLSRVALRQCNLAMPFAKTVFLTDRGDFVDPDWEWHRIKQIRDFADFNKFMLKNVYYHIDTEFTLIVQYDGFIINPAAWTDEFLQYDYIGAPFPCTWKEYAVGNGGFSLRSRKLLEALQDDHIILPADQMAEDLCICRTYRSYLQVHHGINFAPVEVASRFAWESGPYVANTFGFHGLSQLAGIYAGETAPFLASNLPAYVLRRHQAVILALQYAYRSDELGAASLFQRIAEQQTYEQAREQLVAVGAGADMLDLLETSWPRYVGRVAA